MVSVLSFSTLLGKLFLTPVVYGCYITGEEFRSTFVCLAGYPVFSWRFFIPRAFHCIPDFLLGEVFVISSVRGILSLCSDEFMVLSSVSLSSAVKYSTCFKVSRISAVSIPSGFRSVVICVLFLLPAANLCT